MENLKRKITGTQFEKDLSKTMGMNDGVICVGIYNLIISIRDMKMYCKVNMKPNRHWKISNVKNYFGIKGGKDKILMQLEEYMITLKNDDFNNSIFNTL